MKKQIHLWIILPLIALVAACASEPKEKAPEKAPAKEAPVATKAVPAVQEQGDLKVYPIVDSPKFPGASLEMKELEPGEKGETKFAFGVGGYELGVQTPTSVDRTLANSAKGQHIHLIVDNGPYSAHYEPEFSKKLEPGNHVILAFLSRSYHESVKNERSFALTQTNVDGRGEGKEVDLEQPHMFYSRPKGTYSGSGTDLVMVDFFLVNTTLSPNGNKVRCNINGNEFMFTKWMPYQVEGLPMGENVIRLELIDAEGNSVPSPFNPVERTFTLTE